MLRLAPLCLALVTTPAFAVNWRSTSTLQDRTTFQNLITSLDTSNTPIDAWAVEPDGDWFVAAAGAVSASPGFSRAVVNAANWNLAFGRTIRAADCNAAGVCVLVHSAGYYTNGVIPAALGTTINSWTSAGTVIRDVELAGSGWLLLGPGNVAAYSGLDTDLRDAIWDRHGAARTIRDVSVGTDGRWMLLADQNPMSEGLSASQLSTLNNVVRGEHAVDKLLLGTSGNYVIYNHDDDLAQVLPGDPISAIELTAGGTNIWDRMAAHGIVGASVAVVEGNQVIAGRGYGARELGADGAVLSSTPFDLASLSKYVGALTTYATLEWLDTQPGGGLDVDDDVIDARIGGGTVDAWLGYGETSPAIRGFPAGLPDLPAGLTIRRLLSHTGSMLIRGSTPAQVSIATDPPLVDWMSGWRCVGAACGWSTNAYAWTNPAFGPPGSGYNYSNAGFLLTMATLEDYTGMSGADLMDTFLFDPIGLSDVSGQYPIPADFLARRSRQHDQSGGLQPEFAYPWTFAGGVNASAADYAELVILALNEGRSSAGDQILSPASIQAMMTNNFAGGVAVNYGQGLLLGDGTATETNDAGIWHNGGHPGLAVTWFCGVPERDQAIVILLNTDSNARAGGDPLHVNNFVDDVMDAYRASVGWPGQVSCGI
jgi:CubicO group peptidase (beta-lactamase class C family)